MFTAGVDVHVFEGLDRAAADELTASLLEITHAVEDLPFPVLAAVHGLCLTAGLELALACDLLWAAERRALRAGGAGGRDHAADGRNAADGGARGHRPRARVRHVGRAVRRGRDARWGVVNRVVARDALLDRGGRLRARGWPTARRSRTRPPSGWCARRPITARAGPMTRTAELTSHLFETSDSRDAVQSFLQHGPGKADFHW